MRKLNFLFLICLAVGFFSCGESDLLDDYIADSPKVLAVKIQDPEARPGDPISMRLLVGGRNIDQDMDEPVFWFIDDESLLPLGESIYNQEFISQLPADDLNGEQWFDLPILSRIKIGSKFLNAQKIVRITQAPKAKNPVINGVQVTYLEGNRRVTDKVINGDTILLSAQVANIAFTALTDKLAPGENDELVFRWYVSASKNSNGLLYINDDSDVILALLGNGVKASERKPSAVFSLKGENSNGSIQTGIYDIYLIVRDNASKSNSSADDRFGTDFIYFTLCVNGNC
jgi:hypothetical protein